MRRLYSILLSAALLLSLLAPLLSTGAAAQSGLAACCRRGGRHQCMGGMALAPGASQDPRFQTLQERCPYPQRVVAAAHHEFSTFAPAPTPASQPLLQSTRLTQFQSVHRLASARSHQKRGPPALLS